MLWWRCSGDIVVLMLAKTDAIRDWRALMGPTNVDRARSEAPDRYRCILICGIFLTLFWL